jgi:hypothetical protein
MYITYLREFTLSFVYVVFSFVRVVLAVRYFIILQSFSVHYNATKGDFRPGFERRLIPTELAVTRNALKCFSFCRFPCCCFCCQHYLYY